MSLTFLGTYQNFILRSTFSTKSQHTFHNPTVNNMSSNPSLNSLVGLSQNPKHIALATRQEEVEDNGMPTQSKDTNQRNTVTAVGTDSTDTTTTVDTLVDWIEANIRQKENECNACLSHSYQNDWILLPCGHFYCASCLKHMFLLAMEEPSRSMHYRPRCCDHGISFEVGAKHLSQDEALAYQLCFLESDTVDRTYCSDIGCSKFVPPAQINQSRDFGSHLRLLRYRDLFQV